jgi:hypothetical protein
VQQVFYCRDSRGPEWRIATKIEVRGRRGDRQYALEEDGGLFAVGHDFQFPGLSANLEADRARRQADPEGEHVVVQDVPLGAGITEFESDGALLGDSSEDDM